MIDRRRRARNRSFQAGALLSALFAVLAAPPARAADRFEVGLIGDLPYSPQDDAGFERILAELNAAPLAFVVHVGDIMWDARAYAAVHVGLEPCTDAAYAQRKALLDRSVHPLVVLPGDNDWTDCVHVSGVDPLERLAKFREVFCAGDESLGKRTMPLVRQGVAGAAADARYPENVRVVHGGILFVTVHMVGGNDNRGISPECDAESLARGEAGRAWLAEAFAIARRDDVKGVMVVTHANPYFEDTWPASRKQALHAGAARRPDPQQSAYAPFLAALEEQALAYARPVVLVHGDTHVFRVDKPLLDSRTGRLVANFTRVEVFGSPDSHWIRATIDPADPEVFSFAAEVVAENAIDHQER